MGTFENDKWRHTPAPSADALHGYDIVAIVWIHKPQRLTLIQSDNTMSNSAANSKASLIHVPNILKLYAHLLTSTLKFLVRISYALYIMRVLALCAKGFLLAFVILGVPFNESCSPVFAKRFEGVIWTGGSFQNVLSSTLNMFESN